jgi:CheY-like chemotaxis protein
MNHTILLVEDEDDLRETMRDALEFNGYAVVAATDGLAALEELDRIEDISLVLLDLLMPRMNGWDFLDQLRSRPALAGVPVIVHSSAPSPAPPGATRILQKPLELQRLLAVVRDLCPA